MRMVIWSLYSCTPWTVVASDDELSALEVAEAVARARLFDRSDATMYTERLDLLTMGLVRHEWPYGLLDAACYPEAL